MGEHFVLIHGAWHGGWCWDGIIQKLVKAGHTAEAPTMPGHNPDDDRSQIKFDDYVAKICDVLNQQTRPVVLVGHSSGGYMLQAAAPKVPDKIARLIFLNAFILPEGKNQFDLVPPEASEAMTAAAQASPDNCVPVIEDFVRNMLMAGEPAAMQEALIKRLVPQPLSLFTTPAATEAFDKLSIPRSVVFCNGDVSLPPGAYLGMAQGLGEFNLVEVAGSHEAFFTNPGGVVEGFLKALTQLTPKT
ncbi:salicylate esterase [Olavius sp. associated proteobacterium Delta 1]|nr:salicylate esterase [Olavius sp. associated proteobacterium Delta 1]